MFFILLHPKKILFIETVLDILKEDKLTFFKFSHPSNILFIE